MARGEFVPPPALADTGVPGHRRRRGQEAPGDRVLPVAASRLGGRLGHLGQARRARTRAVLAPRTAAGGLGRPQRRLKRVDPGQSVRAILRESGISRTAPLRGS